MSISRRCQILKSLFEQRCTIWMRGILYSVVDHTEYSERYDIRIISYLQDDRNYWWGINRAEGTDLARLCIYLLIHCKSDKSREEWWNLAWKTLNIREFNNSNVSLIATAIRSSWINQGGEETHYNPDHDEKRLPVYRNTLSSGRYKK